MSTLAELVVKLILDAGKFSSDLSGAMGQVKSAGAGITSVGTSLTAGVTLPLVGIGLAAAKTAGDFESSMNTLSLAARSSGTGLDDLRAAALAAGADTKLVGISAAQAGESFTAFYKAGLDTSEVFGDLQGYLKGNVEVTGAFRAAVDLAAASELDLAGASDAVIVAMSTYNLTAADAGRISNAFVQAADASVASVLDLVDAQKNVGPTMASFGYSLEDVNTALAILSERGIKGAEAGTNLKSMMLSLMKPGGDAVATLKSLNVALYDTQGRLRPIPAIIGDLEKAMSGMTDEQKQATATTLAGSYGLKAFNTLLAEGKGGWDEMAGAIKAGATAQATAAVQTQGFNASMETLKGSLETLLITVGTPLIRDFLTPAAKFLAELASQASKANPTILKFALILGGVAAAAGPVLIMIGSVIGAIGTIGAAIGGLGTLVTTVGGGIVAAITAIGWPILLIVGAVAALYLAWTNNWFGIREAAAKAGEVIQAILYGISRVFTAVGAALSGEISWKEAWTSIQVTVEGAWSHIKAITGLNTEAIKSTISGAWDFIVSAVQGRNETVNGIISNALATAQSTITSVYETIKGYVMAAWEWIKTTIFNALVSIVASVLGNHDQAVAVVTGAWENIKAIIGAALTVLQGLISTAWEAIKTITSTIWEAMKGLITVAINDIKGIITATLQLLSGDVDGAWATMKKTVLGHIEGIASVGETLFKGFSSAVMGILSNLVDLAGGAGAGLIESIKSGITSRLQGLLDAVRRLAQQIRDALPGSDAKWGPLSDLTASGKALPLTLAAGIKAGEGTLFDAVAGLLEGGMGGWTPGELGGKAGDYGGYDPFGGFHPGEGGGKQGGGGNGGYDPHKDFPRGEPGPKPGYGGYDPHKGFPRGTPGPKAPPGGYGGYDPHKGFPGGVPGGKGVPTPPRPAPIPPVGGRGGGGGTSTGAGGNTYIYITVNNPRPEAAERSIMRELQRLAALGVLNPIRNGGAA